MPTLCPCCNSVSALFLALMVFSEQGFVVEGLSCACAAQDEGFAIDCSNNAAMTSALAAFAANDCSTDCTTQVCRRNYWIMQSHDDYCADPEAVPSTIKDALVFYAPECDECTISKQYDPGLPNCSSGRLDDLCSDESGNEAFQTLSENGCALDCTNLAACKTAYQTLKVVHDSCPKETLSLAASSAYNDMEKACSSLHGCNAALSGDPNADLVCKSEDGGRSSGSAIFGRTGSLPIIVTGVLGVLLRRFFDSI